ncbi:hypothetical protein EG68_01369 [Paragonimus skrjabini miyazakii]|uniref:Integrin beta n=1 Tax=Paragonimus skrjabini miyazakii TaxID=59628 RepID=A0A8S9Z0K7_9TREM|nr:hypothetical protein EG68_01369 [Paragonimus skrjabini miyazakii]
MGIDPRCSWCFDDEFDDTKEGPGYRCALFSVLADRGCPLSKIENVKSSVLADYEVDSSHSASGDIQLTPRSRSVSVRPNEALVINFTFQSISDYPVDLYFLTDLSYTMSDDLETVSHLTNDIVLTMRNVTKKLQMGFGAFVDKPVFPFVVPTPEYLRNPCLNVGTRPLQCDPPFLFKHILSLTENFEEFKEKTQVTRPSGNLDSPEGGLDALLQVARCGDHIKWRANARKIVLFASDGGFHLAGDGRIAGLIRPPPTTCQLTYQADRFNSSLSYYGWHTADQTDYPSVGEASVISNFSIILFVYADCFLYCKLHALYTKLAAFLPSAAVGILSDSSTNIVRLLRDNYDKIANKAELMTTYDSDSLEVQVLTRCNHESSFAEKTVCNDHPVGGRIDYQISVKPKRCFAGKKAVSLKMVALEDQFNHLGLAESQRPIHVLAAVGVLVGSVNATWHDMKATIVSVTDMDVSELLMTIKFAEDHKEGFVNAMAPVSVNQVTRAIDGPKCSGRGVCDCGQCFCNSGYTGHLCNEIQGGESALCTDRGVERCVLCLRDSLVKAFDKSETAGADDTSTPSVANTGTPTIQSNGEVVYVSPEYANAAAVCGSACNGTVIDTARVKLIDNNEQKDDSNLCIIYTDDSCRIFFTYRYSDAIYVNRKVDLNIMRKSECAKTINILYIVLGVVAGIVLGGIILLLIYKLVITIDDRRELAKFEQQGENMRWEMAENPIFESPTTKVINPTYEESGY